MKMKQLFSCFTLSVLLGAGSSFGQVVIQHSGANDPLTEGFTVSTSGNPKMGPVFGDGGLDAWSIKLASGAEVGVYQYYLSPLERQLAKTQGWTLSARVKLLETEGTSIFGSGITINLSLDENGDPVVGDSFLGEHTILDGGGNYHEYSLIYDPIASMASLWVNGDQIGSMPISPDAAPPDRVRFGAGQNVNHAHWNEVTFAIVPEPATFALLAGFGALLVAGGFRWRMRRL